jgi:hypothetical protein
MNESDIYIICPRCSEKVHYELTRCPNCGLNFYPEEEAQGVEVSSTGSLWLRAIGGIILATLVSGMATFSIHFVMGLFFTGLDLNSTAKFILFLAGPVGAFAGGYIASAVIKNRVYLYGLVIGILTIPMTVLLNTHWQYETRSLFPPSSPYFNWVIILAAALAGCYLYRRLQQGALFPRWNQPNEKKLYQDLLAKARFDRDRVERLIDYEKRRNPFGSRSELLKSAIERWERDNR